MVGRVDGLGSEAAEKDVSKAIMREAVVMQMTWPGAPTIYYGDEAGVCGFTDPDNRRTYPWGKEDTELIRFHKEMILIHKMYPIFTHGSLKILTADYNCLSYGRFSFDEQIAVAFNNNKEEKTMSIPVWQLGVADEDQMVRLMMTDEEGFTMKSEIYDVEKGFVELTLPPLSAVVLKKILKTEN